MKTLTIIDTFGFFFRLFYALKGFTTSAGKPSGMVAGFANFIYSLKNEFSSDYLIFALDSKGKTFRSEIDTSYKANRQAAPDELLEQIPVCIEMIKKMGFCAYSQEGYEADDIIASVVKFCEDKDIFVRIITQDKDLYQLIKDGKVSIYSPISKNDYNEAGCLEKYGVKPTQIKDFLALCGDTADNIPGVKGIGAKGAKTLLDEFGSLEGIYENLPLVRNERTKNLLIEGKDNAFLSKKLTSLYDELDISFLFTQANYDKAEPLLEVLDILQEYELNLLLKKLKSAPQNMDKNLGFKATLITDENELFELLKGLDESKIIAFDTETTGLEKNAEIVGFSFALNEQEAYYVPLAHSYLGAPQQLSKESAKRAIKMIYDGFVVGHNLKFDFKIIENNFDLKAPANYADTMILAWLYEPSKRVNMDDLAKRLFEYETIKFEQVVPKGANFSAVALENATKYAAEDAYITLRFYLYFLKNLDSNLLELAKRLEFPFIKVIMSMENGGIHLDTQRLSALMQEFSKDIKALSDEIYALTAEKFNLNSPKQVGEVLFVKLGLPSGKKGKSGVFSTDEKVLNELVDKHPVAQKLLDYRELAKLYSTYCEPLLKLAQNDENSRIYSNFMQTGTATGRLASKDPNLQNIPAHGQYAKAYKSCFTARQGHSFLSLDYSQIELRMLAHFSEDEKLLQAFADDEDIHARTAVMIFGESNYETRSIAKSINFGLIYGMGYKTLSQNLKIEANLAKSYIERYFANFTSIKDYFERVKESARQNGFISTLLGRKRYFDFNTASPMIKASYERESVNSILQGSAADIIKLAMLEIYPHLDEGQKLILQIHDELIFEIKDEKLEKFATITQDIMQNVVKLKVNLKTSSAVAKNWGELK